LAATSDSVRPGEMDTAAWISLAISFLAVGVAIVVPLAIERARRPDLQVGKADDGNARHLAPPARFVHARVTNRPLKRWLQRDTANGCKVDITFRSRSDGKVTTMQGRWSATPQPLNQGVFDNERVPQTLRFDLPPDEAGEVIPVAIKRDGDANAFGFTSESYGEPTLCLSSLALPDEEYDVEVRVHAGPVEARASFLLKNSGSTHRDLHLQI
jgi:hypothetical protein